MSKKLTWLHISDIHFHPKTEWCDGTSRLALLEHLKSIFAKDDSLRPDFIFCTGDIAFGESSNAPLSGQYAQAKIFFDDLLLACGQTGVPLPKERLFVVPGNHDVNRSSINSDAQDTLTRLAKQAKEHIGNINQRFNDRNTEFKDNIKRLDEYAQFIKEFLPHQHDADGRHHYASISDFNGIKVGIAGFNSAWTCAGDEDDRNIWLAANWQFDAAHKELKDASLCIGLMHHPVDWLNLADREIANCRLASDYHFWLHGHSHSAWITPIQSHIVIAAGAVGAQNSDEFGINITCIDLNTMKGISHLHSKKVGSNGWTIEPVAKQAPAGQWHFDLPVRLRRKSTSRLPVAEEETAVRSASQSQVDEDENVGRYLSKKLDEALRTFSSQPKVCVTPILRRKSEIDRDAKSEPKVDLSDFVANPKSTIIKAPPQYGLTCLSHFLVREAWQTQSKSLWLYLDTKNLKPHAASINEAISNELQILGCSEQDFKCVILDSWSANEKDAFKLLSKLCDRFKNVPIICMQQVDIGVFNQINTPELERQFDVLYLWALSREGMREIITACNEARHIVDEDAAMTRLTSDLDVLNLHRTALNCLTLLKVSELELEESPVNRFEMIKKVLYLIFNATDIPSYKSRPDQKDCEYVLGYFCELLIRDGNYSFTRERFLTEIQRCSQEKLIDLETHIVFDVLFANNILVRWGNFFYFKFSYWVFYFAAQRMQYDQSFADYIFTDMRYANYPELIEFYTGIDRRRDDALIILIKDIKACRESIQNKCGFPEGFNPYEFATWKPTLETEAQMEKIISNGVQESNLPATIKDQYADRTYDPMRPYDQSIASLLTEHSFNTMMQTMKAGARALRNSDYAPVGHKRQLLEEILNCWEQASKVMFIVLPILAKEGRAVYDGTGFVLAGDFGDTPQRRFVRILCEIPNNVVSWFQDDLFSRKMGPLLIDQLNRKDISGISKHELILLLIHQRPRDWSKQVQRYIATHKKNSYYLFDVYQALRNQYQYSFASPQTLRDIEHLIKMTATKHVTGDKEPGIKSINKVKFSDDVIPHREV